MFMLDSFAPAVLSPEHLKVDKKECLWHYVHHCAIIKLYNKFMHVNVRIETFIHICTHAGLPHSTSAYSKEFRNKFICTYFSL